MAEELSKEEEMQKYSTVPLEELSPEEYKTLKEYVNLPEEQKKRKKKESKYVRCKLPVEDIERLEELFPGKRCRGVRKAVQEYTFKYAPPRDTDLARAWEVLRTEYPETEGFEYFEGNKVIAKGMGIEESEAYGLFDKLIREGFVQRIQTGDYVVYSSRIGTETQIEEEMRLNKMLEELRGKKKKVEEII